MFASIGSRRFALVLLATGLTASTAAAQATIERVIGPPTGAMVQLAGASHAEPGAAGRELQPGDMLTTDSTTKVELRCTTPGAPIYRVAGGFRGYIDVPVNKRCTMAIAEGHADVIAEDTTNTIGGTIALASKGTQYAVDVMRDGRTFACNVAVYEGEVFSRGGGETAAQGSTIQWVGRSLTGKGAVQPAQIERSAALYASFDVAAAKAASPQAGAVSYQQLKSLHYEVLAHPTDTAKRVELAKRQIQYKVDQQAAYNLKRANVTDDRALQRYQINPETIRSNRVLREGVYRTSRAAVRAEGAAAAAASPAATETTSAADRAAVRAGAARVAPGAAARAAVTATPPPPAPPPPAYPAPTTDSDLQLITAGKIDEAIRNLEARVATPDATSRDHYALAKAYDGRDQAKVRQHASQAIKLHAADGKLSDAELQAVRELLATAG
jgi:hypothetical protein